MIIAGWGKKGRHVAYLGIDLCTNCHKWSHFNLEETADQLRLYFVPAGRYNKKHIGVCTRCGMAWDVAPADVAKLKAQAASLPTEEQAVTIWERCDVLLWQGASEPDREVRKRAVLDQLRREFAVEWADYVFERRMKALGE